MLLLLAIIFNTNYVENKRWPRSCRCRCRCHCRLVYAFYTLYTALCANEITAAATAPTHHTPWHLLQLMPTTTLYPFTLPLMTVIACCLCHIPFSLIFFYPLFFFFFKSSISSYFPVSCFLFNVVLIHSIYTLFIYKYSYK